MNNPIFKYTLFFVLVVLLQIFLLNNINFLGFCNPAFYIIFILLLPFDTIPLVSLVLAFLLGFIIDVFSNTFGVNAAATLLAAFIRPYVLKYILKNDEQDSIKLPRMSSFGIVWFVKYTTIIVLVHHIVLFYLEAFTFSSFFFTLYRALISSILTIILIIITQLFLFKTK
jgi:rod shape-determining protein MreD